MFDSLLIANRGEIACRIARTARSMGLRVIAVYSEADRGAPHVRLADEAILLGPAPALDSYLNLPALLEAIEISGAAAVHPGYGFFSENAEFAEAVTTAGAVFVGPSADSIRAMGSKIEAKNLVAQAGAPVVPGYSGDDQSATGLAARAEEVGFPLLIKASAGGGGKGMRIVHEASEFAAALAAAQREAAASFADDRVLLERFLTEPKHIEVQVLGDQHGNLLHLFERDCSVQRRHQKVIEEAPGPSISADVRSELAAAALRAASAIDYVGAGTVEFIAEGDEFFFMEMNTRLQVEHPVTEAITGLDLVEWQLRVAAGEALPFAQDELAISGHAIEARVYAENPQRKFLPSTGELQLVAFPDHVRVDSGVETGGSVSMHYDPMLAKVVATGATRAAAIAGLDRALANSAIVGVQHNMGFLRRLLADDAFVAGDYTTKLIERAGDALLPEPEQLAPFVALLELTGGSRSGASAVDQHWRVLDGFQVNGEPRSSTLRLGWRGDELRCARLDRELWVGDLCVQVEEYEADGCERRMVLSGEALRAHVVEVAGQLHICIGGSNETIVRVDPLAVSSMRQDAGSGKIESPMPGQVLSVAVAQGDQVAAGDVLVVVEAMKMEHQVTAPSAGRVERINCAPGARVDEGFELVVIS
ncbi:MAG: biotin/lipoyl-binding protein [Pseudomonadaceae bacterium]|nr:biotin/lipoyl-binding protein [Pseudomonadaceae bacterium]